MSDVVIDCARLYILVHILACAHTHTHTRARNQILSHIDIEEVSLHRWSYTVIVNTVHHCHWFSCDHHHLHTNNSLQYLVYKYINYHKYTYSYTYSIPQTNMYVYIYIYIYIYISINIQNNNI